MILINTLLLCRKFLFLKFTGKYTSKFAERMSFFNVAKKMHDFFFQKIGLLIKIGLRIMFFLGEIDFDLYLNLTGNSLPQPLEVVKPVLMV